MSEQISNNTSEKNKRIAKNTFVLYIRMLFLIAINLYTSRVILQALGEDDFGIYNVVGGFVIMFSVLSKSLSGAASRFLNYEIGKGNFERLSRVFSATLTIQIILTICIFIIIEIVGVWFVNNKMVLPEDRLEAANWVFQFSVLTFCSNLISVPYNAAIIAHERMKAFAYVSIFEGIVKLVIAFAVMVSPIDTLIFYAALIFLLQFSVQFMYRSYCQKKFEECTYRFILDKPLFRELFGYAGWNFLGSASATLRTQGGNILINIFFGPAVNAARAVSNQILQAVIGLAQNFVVAIKPQITQSYASGNYDYMMNLIFSGARMTYYLLWLLSFPILLNTEFILGLWLKEIPDHTTLFVQLTLIFSMLEHISETMITAQLATGKIRDYQIVVGGIQLLNLPLSYIVYRLGGAPESYVIVAIGCGVVCLIARLYMIRPLIGLKIKDFIYRVIFNIFAVTIVSAVIPVIMFCCLDENIWSFVILTIMSVISSISSIYLVGLNQNERNIVIGYVSKFIKKRK